MMADLIGITLRARLPWWWRAYMKALCIAARAGFRMDASKAVGRIINQIRFEVI